MQKDFNLETHYHKWSISKPGNGDSELWLAMKAGDETAFMIIYQKFFSRLYNYGCKICSDKEVVEDCIQDLFVDLWNKRGTLGETDSITYYLFAVLKRRIIRVLNREQLFKSNHSTQVLHISELNTEENIIMEEIAHDQKQKIVAAMQQLSQRQQQVLQLRYLQDYNHEEIAQTLSIKIESVYNLLSKAIRQIKKHMVHVVSLFATLSFVNHF